jgi:ligand-binding SRPBCC domain-containing protein
MSIYSLSRTQVLYGTIDEIWDFISSPENLEKICPKDIDFKITSVEIPKKIYPGQIISYSIKPFPWFKTTWVTEITHVVWGRYFVDEQRRGPYKLWHHQHHLKEVTGGVEMTDLIHYEIPLGIFGRLLHHFIIKQQLQDIFDYRRRVLCSRFDKTVSQSVLV